jgi:CRP-like cAMP-binding protein
MANLIDKALLQTFVPLDALNQEIIDDLASRTYVEDVAKGETIFEIGDKEKQSVYLIEGEVKLQSFDGTTSILKAGTPQAKHALSNLSPRKHTAEARQACRIIRIDSEFLEILMTWDQMAGIEVDEITVDNPGGIGAIDSGDWMTKILQSKAFLQIPPANIQAMFMRMQEVVVNAGETIIKQGDEGDFYYIIKKGKCKVTKPSKTNSELVLANLNDGDAFGEEALLSEAKRNANIIMVTDGLLMRLSKEDFNELLKEPMLTWIANDEAEKLVEGGKAVWMDVRLESEFSNNGITGAINVPLFMLRMSAEKLDPGKNYILYCDTGRRSSAGAFLLSERGFNAYCLKDGLSGRG